MMIDLNRSLRSKTQVKSVLDDIPGIGPARRKALMKHFDTIEDIRNAGMEELMQVPEIPQKSAEEIYAFFREKQK